MENSELVAWDTGSAVIGVWAGIAQAQAQARMQKDLIRFNNNMRGINASVQQYTNDVNRNALADANANSQMQIDTDRMRVEGAIDAEAGATGASASARIAAMFDVNRNAALARGAQAQSFEASLKQIKLQEFGQQLSGIQSYQNPANVTAPGIGAGLLGSALTGARSTIDAGAFDTGGIGSRSIRAVHQKFFTGGSGVTLEGNQR